VRGACAAALVERAEVGKLALTSRGVPMKIDDNTFAVDVEDRRPAPQEAPATFIMGLHDGGNTAAQHPTTETGGRHHTPLPQPESSRTHYVPPIPLPPTPLIGRQHEITAITTLLVSPEVRLVTLTGAGGSGETRLALQVAAQLDDTALLPDGVCVVELVTVSDSDFVASTITHALGIAEQSGTSAPERLRQALRKAWTAG
jgi:hypothetical protein